MEPRPHERGKSGIFARSNGIKRGLQWSHVLTNVESSRPRSPKQHERTLQWSHVLTNVERRLLLLPWLWLRRFNGATSSRTWKAVCTVRSNTDEKLQWSHVLTNVERFDHLKRPRRDDCFNGATSSRTWKGPSPLVSLRRTQRLQWSHVLTNVERCKNDTPPPLKQASMEPRPHERGKIAQPAFDVAHPRSFNGATSSRTWKDNQRSY